MIAVDRLVNFGGLEYRNLQTFRQGLPEVCIHMRHSAGQIQDIRFGAV